MKQKILKKLPFSIYRITKKESTQLAYVIFRNRINKLLYRRKNDKYEVYCPNCNTTMLMNKKEFKVYLKVKVCSNCYHEFENSGRRLNYNVMDYAYIDVGDAYQGYRIRFEVEFNRIKNIETEIVYYKNKNDNFHYRYGIFKNMSGTLSSNGEDFWRCSDTRRLYYSNNYTYMMYAISNIVIRTKREYLESISNGLELKSNQVYMVKHNLINYKMINAMVAFDINDYQDLINCSAYINKYKYFDSKTKLNKHVLYYLSKNNIKCSDYQDYLKQCAFFGINNKYPKNFEDIHKRLSKRKRDMDDNKFMNQLNKKIIKRYKKLNIYSFSKKHFNISPIENCDELHSVGEKLDNCIFDYKEKYAVGKCDLFAIRKDGDVVCAIEISENIIKQARIYHNKDPKGDLKVLIKQWSNKFHLIYE
ncbi:MAG: PcfJ domain-containing protein [Anaerorhabdus sp.]|uniref:PcfJ domain-containing protein n=1 Tax=Anaerorhabdus sp. TaxID=1872524 RepID=UPI002FCABAA5